ncbi:heterokaryon incompatibility protein-domain-containing protein [Cadophora sp. MPI-SDFR-AT-0126]|nr:heterokaryon incompatibility protein-domain-containing protein [Leotiomycetes sp. MPI-SDFR-AT-0126]
MSVTENLHNALKRLRYPNKIRTLWADAICINQGNTRERSHHVAFMDIIYKNADAVLVDMGQDIYGGGSQVVSLIQDHQVRSFSYSSLEDMPVIDATDPIVSDPRWKGVSTLLKQPWFSRAWVIQEAGLGKTVIAVYGQVEFDYRDFIRLMKWVVKCAGQLEARYDLMWWYIHLDWSDWSKPPNKINARDLLVFLYQAKALKCKDPRDHIYAFSGHSLMRSEDGTAIVTPNYDEEFEVAYWKVAEYFLASGDTRILASIEHDEDSFSEGQTWVPRWDINLIMSDFGVLPENWYRFSGSKEDEQEAKIGVHKEHIEVRGVLFDVIRKSFQFPAVLQAGFKDHLILDRVLAEVKTGLVNYPSNGQDLADAFSLTICAGRTTYSYEPAEENMKQHRDNFAAYWKLRQSALRPGEPTDDFNGDPNEGDAVQFVLDIQQSCQARSFVITEKGYVGLGPWISKPGDVCCLIPGSRVPFVLREGGDARFRLVGEAYLHGLMRGEVFDLIVRDDLKKETIVIW